MKVQESEFVWTDRKIMQDPIDLETYITHGIFHMGSRVVRCATCGKRRETNQFLVPQARSVSIYLFNNVVVFNQFVNEKK